MIRICRLVVVRQVATNALSRRAGEMVVQVTLTTLETRVGARKGKLSQGVVIEFGVSPR